MPWTVIQFQTIDPWYARRLISVNMWFQIICHEYNLQSKKNLFSKFKLSIVYPKFSSSWNCYVEKKEKSTWKKTSIPRGKHHNKTATKTTVSLYLSKNVVEKSRFHNLNLSRIAEQALISILDYLETQNTKPSSKFLGKASFHKEGFVVPRAGLELATTRSSASPSTILLLSRVLSQSELPRRHSTWTTTCFLSFLKSPWSSWPWSWTVKY